MDLEERGTSSFREGRLQGCEQKSVWQEVRGRKDDDAEERIEGERHREVKNACEVKSQRPPSDDWGFFFHALLSIPPRTGESAEFKVFRNNCVT